MKNQAGNGSSRVVQLKDLRPNPLRDFRLDPIEDDRVKMLVGSIKEAGFWGGVTLFRLKDGTYIIGAGHTRVQAAIEAGETEIVCHVRDAEGLSDLELIRVYAIENATQRGNSSVAMLGTIAATIRVLAKDVLLGGRLTGQLASDFDLQTIRRNLGNEKGIGRPLILKVLEGIPSINDYTVKTHINLLKTPAIILESSLKSLARLRMNKRKNESS
jgi:hypothetical protein